jgi:hypothetical protein
VLIAVLFYDNLSTEPCMTSKQASPPFSVNCNKTLLNANIFQYTPRNVMLWDFTEYMLSAENFVIGLKNPKFSQLNRLILRLENFGKF